MKKSTNNYTIEQFKTMVKNGTVTFDNPFQRPSGQWSINNKSLLVDSALRLFIPEMWALKKVKIVKKVKDGVETEKKVNVYEIIDGKQRGTTFVEILNDEVKMSKLDDFYLDTTGEDCNITGLKFSEFPDEIQSAFKGYSLILRIVELEEGDDEEEIVRDIVTRLNSGVAMAKAHLAYINSLPENKKFIDKMIAHPFMTDLAYYTATQERASEPHSNIMQTMALLDKIEYTKFTVPVVGNFMATHEVSEETKENIEKSFDMFVEYFKNKETNKFFNKINWVSVVRLFVENNLDEEILPFAEEYMTKIKAHDMYRKYCGQGGTEKSNIVGRVNGLQHLYNEFKNRKK